VLKGARPIHIYLDGIDITDICTIDGTLIIVTDVPAGSMIYVNIHLDYALKGTTYESLDDFGMKSYFFEVNVSGSGGSPSIPGQGLIGTYDSPTNLIAHHKKTTAIAGYIKDFYGNPIANAIVELFDSDGNLVGTAITDENGFYYFLDIAVGNYTVKVTYNFQTYIQAITVAKNELAQVDFTIG